MITLLSRQLIDVMPEVADHYLDFNTLEEQRAVREWRVEELVDKMKRGLFRYGNIAFCKIKGQDRKVLIDGQHVCFSIVKFNNTVQSVVENWEVNNKIERSELFRQYEILARGLPEMVRVESGALSIRWPNWVTNIVVAAIAIDIKKKGTGTITHSTPSSTPTHLKKMITASSITKEKRVEHLRNYIKEGTFINSILTDGDKYATRKKVKHIAKAPIVYSIMETWRKNEKKALEFWEQVRDGEYLKKGSPTKELREFLLETCGASKAGMLTPNNHQYIYRIFVAWNAFIEGRKTALRYRPELQPPELKSWSNKTGWVPEK